MATGRVVAMLRREALVMSFSDVFLAMTALFLAIAMAAFLVKRPAVALAGGGH
jgi:MFS transporter, DHA2 family, multidrug resistance protein